MKTENLLDFADKKYLTLHKQVKLYKTCFHISLFVIILLFVFFSLFLINFK
jgi:hypothetical protein